MNYLLKKLIALILMIVCRSIFIIIMYIVQAAIMLEDFSSNRKRNKLEKIEKKNNTPWWKLKEFGGWI